MCIYTYISYTYIIVVLYIDTHIHIVRYYTLSNNDQEIFEQNMNEGKDPAIHRSELLSLTPFLCASLIYRQKCWLSGLAHPQPLYPTFPVSGCTLPSPLLPFPLRPSSSSLKSCDQPWWVTQVFPALVLFVSCVPMLRTQFLWGEILFCLWWSPKSLRCWDPILLF